jgi:UDP-galactopyranose mutase
VKTDILIAGAGFAGAVCAERLADAGRRVLVIEKRTHVGGNAFDEPDAQGVLVHRYGPHIFHTKCRAVFEYLSRFTEWVPYEHRVLAQVDGKLLPFPINRDTLNRLYGLSLNETGAAQFLEEVRQPRAAIRSSEDLVLSSVGHDLCEKFFRNYTRKQWGLDLSELSAGVAGRIPVRTNQDDRYFTDEYQFMPRDGYSALFQRLLDHKNISVELGADFFDERDKIKAGLTIYTGPLDAYFGSCLGPLPYRSLRFEHEHLSSTARFQPVGQVNYPNDFDYTRITEFKHLTGQAHAGTSIMREYPQVEGDPYYPIPRPPNEALAGQYRDLAATEKDVIFVGRLAQYRYLNMDQAVGAALKAADSVLNLSYSAQGA